MSNMTRTTPDEPIDQAGNRLCPECHSDDVDRRSMEAGDSNNQFGCDTSYWQCGECHHAWGFE
jgi:hypothetical protein